MRSPVLQFPNRGVANASAITRTAHAECLRRFKIYQSILRSRKLLDSIEANRATADLADVLHVEHTIGLAVPRRTLKVHGLVIRAPLSRSMNE